MINSVRDCENWSRFFFSKGDTCYACGMSFGYTCGSRPDDGCLHFKLKKTNQALDSDGKKQSRST